MSKLSLAFGIVLIIPVILGLFQLMYREIIGHGDCNTLYSDYPTIVFSLAIIGLIIIFLDFVTVV